jgi:hypothetical protein
MTEKEIRDIFIKINAILASQNPAGSPGDPYAQLSVLAAQLLEGTLVNLARLAGSV